MKAGKRRIETGGDPKEKMIINEIMLRFRPIAPRPVSVERSVGFVPVKTKRVKRKYVRVKRKKKVDEEYDNKGWMSLDSMQLVSTPNESVTDPVRKVFIPDQWISFDLSEKNKNNNNKNNKMCRWITTARPSLGLHDVDQTRRVTSRALLESWITMESVIGTCEDENPLGYTDEEILKDMETDSCPGFISNGYDEVQWVNLAYRRMVDPENEKEGAQVVVSLVVKVEKSAFEYWPAFSCRMRVVYDLLSEKKKQITVPCDVWKLDSGGYAWRLDVKAALSLGRLN
ncbi:hypothetical protein HanPI659440_Chr17g0681471 [Helianthus annuus]|nr:hypothetical protein HanPI659440_Chr17g0681471 [Helianthus annuus]